jgi:hypothetical protein
MVSGMNGWRYAHIGVEGDDLRLGGLDVWHQTWRRTGEAALQLPHPQYGNQRHSFDICEIGGLDHPVRFAVSELSNGVYGFYVPA